MLMADDYYYEQEGQPVGPVARCLSSTAQT